MMENSWVSLVWLSAQSSQQRCQSSGLRALCSLSLKLPRARTTQHFCAGWYRDTAWLLIVYNLSVGRRGLFWGALEAFPSPGWGSPLCQGHLTLQVLLSLSIQVGQCWAHTSLASGSPAVGSPDRGLSILFSCCLKSTESSGNHHFPPSPGCAVLL